MKHALNPSGANTQARIQLSSLDVRNTPASHRACPTQTSEKSKQPFQTAQPPVRMNLLAGAFKLFMRAKAHRAMALAALHADHSLAVRLYRYNHHMKIARGLETDGGAV